MLAATSPSPPACNPAIRGARVCMLLSNPYHPDDRVRQEAIALSQAGYQVTLLAWDRDCALPEFEDADGFNVRRARIGAGYNQNAKQIANIGRLWGWFHRQLKSLRPDVVHCHDLDTLPAGVRFRASTRACQVVFDAHECYRIMKQSESGLALRTAILLCERFLVPRAQLIISPCQATGDYYRNISGRNLVVVGNWKTAADFDPPQDSLRELAEKLGIGSRLVVVYIGSLASDRLVMPLVEAVKQKPDVFLILGGRGGQEEALRKLSGGAANIHFPGFIHPREVPTYTALSHLVFYGFDRRNPFAPYNAPNKLYEAIAAGRGILASDIGGELSAVIRETGCGVLLPETDTPSILKALDELADSTAREALQERARLAYRNGYNWGTSRSRLLAAYEDLLASRATGR